MCFCPRSKNKKKLSACLWRWNSRWFYYNRRIAKRAILSSTFTKTFFISIRRKLERKRAKNCALDSICNETKWSRCNRNFHNNFVTTIKKLSTTITNVIKHFDMYSISALWGEFELKKKFVGGQRVASNWNRRFWRHRHRFVCSPFPFSWDANTSTMWPHRKGLCLAIT